MKIAPPKKQYIENQTVQSIKQSKESMTERIATTKTSVDMCLISPTLSVGNQ